MDMKISSKGLPVMKRANVDLGKWPTKVEAVYNTKALKL